MDFILEEFSLRKKYLYSYKLIWLFISEPVYCSYRRNPSKHGSRNLNVIHRAR